MCPRRLPCPLPPFNLSTISYQAPRERRRCACSLLVRGHPTQTRGRHFSTYMVAVTFLAGPNCLSRACSRLPRDAAALSCQLTIAWPPRLTFPARLRTTMLRCDGSTATLSSSESIASASRSAERVRAEGMRRCWLWPHANVERFRFSFSSSSTRCSMIAPAAADQCLLILDSLFGLLHQMYSAGLHCSACLPVRTEFHRVPSLRGLTILLDCPRLLSESDRSISSWTKML